MSTHHSGGAVATTVRTTHRLPSHDRGTLRELWRFKVWVPKTPSIACDV